VTPDIRTQTANENAAAGSTVDPAMSPFCLQGYVWREAYGGTSQIDKVCVSVSSRSQAQADDAAAASRTKVFGGGTSDP
jgi:hypothetical protein